MASVVWQPCLLLSLSTSLGQQCVLVIFSERACNYSVMTNIMRRVARCRCRCKCDICMPQVAACLRHVAMRHHYPITSSNCNARFSDRPQMLNQSKANHLESVKSRLISCKRPLDPPDSIRFQLFNYATENSCKPKELFALRSHIAYSSLHSVIFTYMHFIHLYLYLL